MIRGSSCALSGQNDARYAVPKELMEAKQGGESVMNPFVSLHTVDAVFDGIAVHEPPGSGYLLPGSGCSSLLDHWRIFLQIGEVRQYTS